MKNPNQTTDKQKGTAPPIGTQALQVIAGAPPLLGVTGSAPVALPPASLPPRVTDHAADPPRRSTSSDTSTEELSPVLLRAIQHIVTAVLREHVPVAAPPRLAPPPEADVPEEEDEREAPVPVPPAGRRRNIPLSEPQEVPPQWLTRLEHLQKGLQDVKYQIEGAPEDERQGVPFTKTIMADKLPLNCRTPAIAEYNGTMDPMEHLSRFENASLYRQNKVSNLHHYIRWRSITMFASNRKVRKKELSLFAVRQKDDEPLKEYLQRFNAAALEVSAATQEVKGSAFSKGLMDGDCFKSLSKKPISKFDALLARAAKYINMEEAQVAKKDSRGEKRKEIREEAPSKKPRGQGYRSLPKKEGDKARIVRASSPERSSREEAKQTSGSKGKNNDIPRKGVIRMIAGGDSHQARKSQVREAHQISIKEVLDIETMEDAPIIQFGRAERSGPQTIHNDALVITAILANYEVRHIFIDSGSSADILFGEAYDQMQLGDVSLEKVNTSLYGFAGQVVHPRGIVSLPLMMGRGTMRKTCLLKFLVVDVPSAYNVILGRPTLNIFQTVISTYHMKIKFPTPEGVGEVQGDPLQSRKCYVEAVRRGQKRNVDDTPDQAPPSKKGKAPEEENSEETKTPTKVQPAEELLNIEIIPGNPDKTTRIGSHLGKKNQERDNLVPTTQHEYLCMDSARLGGNRPPDHLPITST
ncbi:UNVERIFIED_CONTAM: hypothetical protein Sradi_2096400 [Sesamum radiatum]|uniref:Retrotransposon gag domain-containing protein n=1 Tax=Sesamum radiatum TaxID=300843 RepID=A0AAW2TIK3_SESRA